MNFSAFGLESSRTPSHVSSSFGLVKVSSSPVTAQDGAAMECVTKTENKVIKVEDKKEEQVAQEVTAEVEEQASEEKQEQKLVEAEAVAEEGRIEDTHLY